MTACADQDGGVGGGGAGGLVTPGKSSHKQPTSETPFKWHFTDGGQLRIRIWTPSPLCKNMMTKAKKTKNNGLNFGPHFLDTHTNNVVVPLSEIKFVLNESVRVDNLGGEEWG